MSLARTPFRFGCFDPAGSDQRPPVTCEALLKDPVDLDAMGKRLEFGARAPLRLEQMIRRNVGQEGLSSRLRSLSTSSRERGSSGQLLRRRVIVALSRKVRARRTSAHM
jgi:hypothetical protein